MKAALVIAALVFSVAPARADQGVGVVVTADGTIQPQLAAQVEDWLRQRGHQLIAAPLRPDALASLIDCFVIEDLACARKVVESESGSPHLLFAKAELVPGIGGTRDVTITSYWFSRGAEPTAARRTCTACTDRSMHVTIDEVMSTLAGKGRADMGHVDIAVTPRDATIRIDGKPAASGAELPVGDHVIEISASGYASERRSVSVRGGERAQLSVTLAAARSSGMLPFMVAGAGVALLATGIALYATSEEDTGEKPEYRDTTLAGITVSTVGIAAIAAGTYLYLRGRSDSAPAVAVVPGGAYVGWVRTF